MKTVFSLLVVTVLFLGLTFKASADPSGHPGYLHALSDLRTARFLLSRDHPGPKDQFAIDEIDRAIHEIVHASIDDGKNLSDHPPVDPTWSGVGRFHHAMEYLDKARHDISEHEDNVYAQGLQARAIDHIDKAHHIVRQIVDQW